MSFVLGQSQNIHESEVDVPTQRWGRWGVGQLPFAETLLLQQQMAAGQTPSPELIAKIKAEENVLSGGSFTDKLKKAAPWLLAGSAGAVFLWAMSSKR